MGGLYLVESDNFGFLYPYFEEFCHNVYEDYNKSNTTKYLISSNKGFIALSLHRVRTPRPNFT